MAKIMAKGTQNATETVIDSRVEFSVDNGLSDKQKEAGMVAKIQVRHPTVSFVANVWQRNGRMFVTTPDKAGDNRWFPLVALNSEVKAHIISLAKGEGEDANAWYLDMLGERKVKITDKSSNKDLGINEIIFDDNLSTKQTDNGVVCKVTLDTTIGKFYEFTVWESKFGKSLYGTAPTEGKTVAGQRGNPGYRLSREATAQVLAYLHGMTDFEKNEKADDVELETIEVENVACETEPDGFEALDEEEIIG